MRNHYRFSMRRTLFQRQSTERLLVRSPTVRRVACHGLMAVVAGRSTIGVASVREMYRAVVPVHPLVVDGQWSSKLFWVAMKTD